MYYYILNPSAGNGSINKIQDKLQSRLKELGIDGEFAKTTGPAEASAMAAAAVTKGYKTIVAVGGDGTVNEVINGISPDKVAVGIIPIGRSNLLASHLGIHSWQQACEVLAARRLIGYSLISAGNQFFLSELSLSVDKSGLGKDQKSPLCRVRIDEKYEIESNWDSLSISNQKFENPLLENKLTVTIAQNVKQPGLVSRFLGKKSVIEANITKVQASRVSIDSLPKAVVVIDGKDSSATPINVKLTDKQIRFISEKL